MANSIRDFKHHACRLMEPDLSMQTRYELALEVRDDLHILHTSEDLNFLKSYFLAFSAILTWITKPQPTYSVEQKLRNVILEILNSLPHNEALTAFVQHLIKVATHVLITDNEENGLICLRIIFGLLRNYRPTLESEVKPFVDFIKQVKESKRVVKCFLNYLRHDKTEVGVLFDMLSIFLVRNCVDDTLLKDFYKIEIAKGCTHQMKKSILVHFLHLFESKELTQEHLVVAIQMFILPVLTLAFQSGQSRDVANLYIIKSIVEKLFDPPEKVCAEYDEPLRIELLQLSTLLIKYLPCVLVNYRKELFKFVWNHLKHKDSESRQWACVNVCHFLEAYQAPENIILQVFVSLLKNFQPENKVLVNQALDILMPALPRILPLGDCKIPKWILHTQKILVDEGCSLPILIHIFQLIVRHSDLFYAFRAYFVPAMVNSLYRLEHLDNTVPENGCLAIELSGIVVGWEKQHQAEQKAALDAEVHAQPVDMSSSASSAGDKLSGAVKISKRPSDASGFSDIYNKRARTESGHSAFGAVSPSSISVDIGAPISAGQINQEYKLNAAMEESIIHFLIRVVLAIEPKDKEKCAMYKQALELLSQALELWPTASVKYNYLEKLLSSLHRLAKIKYCSTDLAHGLGVMNKVLENQLHLFILNNVQQMPHVSNKSKLLGPWFCRKLLDTGKSLCKLLRLVFDACPRDAMNTPHDIRLLHSKVEELIQKHLSAVIAPQIQFETNPANSMIYFSLFVEKMLSARKKSLRDPFMMPLVSIIHCITTEMRTITACAAKQVALGCTPEAKKQLLVDFLHLFQSKDLTQNHLVVAMQMLILPMLVHSFQNGQEWDIVDSSIIKTIVEKLLDPPEEMTAEYDDSLRIELLQLSTLLIKHLPNDLVHHRKILIKFGWNHLRYGSASRQWASVNVCHFLEAYPAPQRIILQVLVSLLRTCQPENKVLANKALDILMPALPQRIPLDESEIPIWIRYTKKILIDEGHSVPNSIHIFQLIVRHSNLFYSYRDEFFPLIVNSLNRLGLLHSSPLENRCLAIQVAGLVVAWEKQHQAEAKAVSDTEGKKQPLDNMLSTSPAAGGKMSGAETISKSPSDASIFSDDLNTLSRIESGLWSSRVIPPSGTSITNIDTPGPAGKPDEEYKSNTAVGKMIINFLERVALVTKSKDKETTALNKQALELLSQASEVWPQLM